MSVINKYPFINAVLTSLSDEDLASLQECVNGAGGSSVFKSILAGSPHLLKTTDKGVYPIELEVAPSGTAQTVYPGFLIYNDDYCVLISFATERSQILTVLDLHLVNGLWNYEIKPFELSITDLRSELFDVAGGGGASPSDVVSIVNNALNNDSIDIAGRFAAPEYDPEETYAAGSVVAYNNKIYVAKEDSVTGEWDSTKWDEKKLTELVGGGTSDVLFQHSLDLTFYDSDANDTYPCTIKFLSKYGDAFVSSGSLGDFLTSLSSTNDSNVIISPMLTSSFTDGTSLMITQLIPSSNGVEMLITTQAGNIVNLPLRFSDNTSGITDTVTPYVQVSGTSGGSSSDTSVGGVDVIEMASTVNGTDIKLRMTFLSGELEEHKADLNAGISQINTATGLSIPLMTNLESLSNMITYLNANVSSDTVYNQCMAGFFTWVKNYSLSNVFIVSDGGNVPVAIEIINMSEGRYRVGYLGTDEVSASMSGTDSMGGQVEVSGLIPSCGYWDFMSSSLNSKYTSLTIKRGTSAGSGSGTSEINLDKVKIKIGPSFVGSDGCINFYFDKNGFDAFLTDINAALSQAGSSTVVTRENFNTVANQVLNDSNTPTLQKSVLVGILAMHQVSSSYIDPSDGYVSNGLLFETSGIQFDSVNCNIFDSEDGNYSRYGFISIELIEGTSSSGGSSSGGATGTGITRLIIGAQETNLAFERKFILWFACSESELYATLNQGFTLLNTQFGTQMLNTNCSSTSDIVANLNILQQINTLPSEQDADNNALNYTVIVLLSTQEKCFKVTAPYLAEFDTDLNSMDLIRGPGKLCYVILSSGNGVIQAYDFDAILGQTTVVYTVAIETL